MEKILQFSRNVDHERSPLDAESDISSLGSSVQNYITFPAEEQIATASTTDKTSPYQLIFDPDDSNNKNTWAKSRSPLSTGKRSSEGKSTGGERKSPEQLAVDDNMHVRQATLETEAMGYRLAKEIQLARAKAKRWKEECNITTVQLKDARVENKRLQNIINEYDAKLKNENHVSIGYRTQIVALWTRLRNLSDRMV